MIEKKTTDTDTRIYENVQHAHYIYPEQEALLLLSKVDSMSAFLHRNSRRSGKCNVFHALLLLPWWWISGVARRCTLRTHQVVFSSEFVRHHAQVAINVLVRVSTLTYLQQELRAVSEESSLVNRFGFSIVPSESVHNGTFAINIDTHHLSCSRVHEEHVIAATDRRQMSFPIRSVDVKVGSKFNQLCQVSNTRLIGILNLVFILFNGTIIWCTKFCILLGIRSIPRPLVSCGSKGSGVISNGRIVVRLITTCRSNHHSIGR